MTSRLKSDKPVLKPNQIISEKTNEFKSVIDDPSITNAEKIVRLAKINTSLPEAKIYDRLRNQINEKVDELKAAASTEVKSKGLSSISSPASGVQALIDTKEKKKLIKDEAEEGSPSEILTPKPSAIRGYTAFQQSFIKRVSRGSKGDNIVRLIISGIGKFSTSEREEFFLLYSRCHRYYNPKNEFHNDFVRDQHNALVACNNLLSKHGLPNIRALKWTNIDRAIASTSWGKELIRLSRYCKTVAERPNISLVLQGLSYESAILYVQRRNALVEAAMDMYYEIAEKGIDYSDSLADGMEVLDQFESIPLEEVSEDEFQGTLMAIAPYLAFYMPYQTLASHVVNKKKGEKERKAVIASLMKDDMNFISGIIQRKIMTKNDLKVGKVMMHTLLYEAKRKIFGTEEPFSDKEMVKDNDFDFINSKGLFTEPVTETLPTLEYGSVEDYLRQNKPLRHSPKEDLSELAVKSGTKEGKEESESEEIASSSTSSSVSET